MTLTNDDIAKVRRMIADYVRVNAGTGGGLTAPVAATDIGGGSVDNTEFGYLNGVTSAIQTQLNTKATAAQAMAIQALRA